MRSKVQKRAKKLEEMESKYGADSPEAHLATERLKLAEKHYDATKEGIKKLERDISKSEYDESLIRRYKEARITNQIQATSVKEIKTGRQEQLANLNSLVYDTDKHEAYSSFETARTLQENKLINSLDHESLQQVTDKTWRTYLNSIAFSLKEQGKMTKEVNNQIKELSQSQPPARYIFGCYSNYLKLNNLSKTHQQIQHQNIASMIGSDTETVKATHKKLREAYLKLEHPPTIPEQWVRGESSTSGAINNPKTRYAPSDPASNYANYSIMYGNDTLPDYQKRASNFITVEQNEDTISLTRYSPTGKLLYSENYDRSSPNSLAQIRQESEGATIIRERMFKNGLSLEEMSNQYLDIPSYSKDNVKAVLKSNSDNIVELFLKTYQSSKKVWNSKQGRRDIII